MGKFTKGLIVVDFLMSCAFCFIALVLYAEKMEWKKRFEQEQKNFKVSAALWQEEEKNKDDKISTLGTEVVALITGRDAAVAESKLRFEDLKDRDASIKQLNNDVKTKEGIISERDNEIKKQREQIDRLRSDNDRLNQVADIAKNNESAAAKEAVRMQNKATESALTLRDKLKELSATQKEREELAWLIEELKRKGVKVDEVVTGTTSTDPVTPIHGKITATMPDLHLVMMNVGKMDKVQVGYQFTVYRSDKYIGKVEIIELHDNMAAARVLTDFKNSENLMIERGDDASTRL